MENNGRVCPICDKLFSNGKALGGHISSHLAKLPVPPKIGRVCTLAFYPKIPTGKRSKRKRKQFIVAKEKEDITQSNEAEKNAENTQCRFVYNNNDIEAMGTLFIMNRKEWQQIKKKYYSEEVGRSGNKDDVANGEMNI
ncbi:zinc finger protein ZAT9 [Trifolium repens]|nr:zinc finger protein ZAT9 [Trifolium repens]